MMMHQISGSATEPPRSADCGPDESVSRKGRGELFHHFLWAAEEERQRLACGIHDDSIQTMAAAGMRLQILRRTLEDPEQLEMLDTLEETVELSIAALRKLAFELRTPQVDREGLTPPLRRYLDFAARQAGILCTLDDHLARQPSSDAGVLIYRIAQESLMDTVKHSGAQTVRVVVEDSEGGFRVRITHDGIGLDPDAVPAAHGLTAIRERAELAGGRLTVLRAEGSGTTIDYWIPELKDVAGAEPDMRAVPPEGSEPAS